MKNHLANIYDKLAATQRAGVGPMRFAFQGDPNGLTQVPEGQPVAAALEKLLPDTRYYYSIGTQTEVADLPEVVPQIFVELEAHEPYARATVLLDADPAAAAERSAGLVRPGPR